MDPDPGMDMEPTSNCSLNQVQEDANVLVLSKRSMEALKTLPLTTEQQTDGEKSNEELEQDVSVECHSDQTDPRAQSVTQQGTDLDVKTPVCSIFKETNEECSQFDGIEMVAGESKPKAKREGKPHNFTPTTLEDRIKIIEFYFKKGSTIRLIRDWHEISDSMPPSRSTIVKVVKNFRSTGNVLAERKPRKRSATSEANTERVNLVHQSDPTKSINAIAKELEMCKSSVHKICQGLGFHGHIGQNKPNWHDAERIRRAYMSDPNKSINAIAKELGLTKTTASRICRRLGIRGQIGQCIPNWHDAERVRHAYLRDPTKSIAALAKEVGLPVMTTHRHCQRLGFRSPPVKHSRPRGSAGSSGQKKKKDSALGALGLQSPKNTNEGYAAAYHLGMAVVQQQPQQHPHHHMSPQQGTNEGVPAGVPGRPPAFPLGPDSWLLRTLY